jgi:hypothetical protein
MTRTSVRLFAACIALAASTLTAYAVDRNVRIHNDTGVTIYRFYSTNSGASKWGSDVMGNSTLPTGSSMRLNFDNKYNYCEFDFRAEFSDGSVLQKNGVNVCEVGDYYYTQ